MNSLFFITSLWAIIGGMIPCMMIAGIVFTQKKYKWPARAALAIIAGPSMWMLLAIAFFVACGFAASQGFKGKTKPGVLPK